MEDKSNLIKQSTKWSKIIRTINQPNPSNSLSYGTNKNKLFETKINQPTNQPTKSINQLATFMYGTGTKKLFKQKSIINQPNPSRRLRYQSIIRPKFSQSTNEETVLDSGQAVQPADTIHSWPAGQCSPHLWRGETWRPDPGSWSCAGSGRCSPSVMYKKLRGFLGMLSP